MYIADRTSLDRFVQSLQTALEADSRLAIDTEFIRERTYHPLLEVVQIAASNGALIGVLDIPALNNDLGGIANMLLDGSILKILHAGSQDMEILTALLGAVPQNIFDTQIAASFAGYALQIGYGGLVQSVLQVQLAKDEGYADWSRRPLTAAMIAYAENDVRYLHALNTNLSENLTARNRTQWALDQMSRSLLASTETMLPQDLWQKVAGRQSLNSTQLAILRELAIWRDEEAQKRDKPRRSVIKDEPLIEFAKRTPRTARDVLELRGTPPNLGEKSAADVAERVRRGQATPPDQRPRNDAPLSLDEEGGNLIELLSAVVRIRAQQEELPASLLATSEELRNFAANRKSRDRYSGSLFTGWKGELIGGDLRETLEGQKTVAWDSRKGRLRLLELDTPFAVPEEGEIK